MQRRTLTVDGMACDGCEKSVEDALAALEGVSGADADHEAGTVSLEASDETADDDDVRAAIEEAGYTVTSA